MIFAYFGIDVMEESLKKACETTELGTTPAQIATGAAKFGMDTAATRDANVEDLRRSLESGLPVIVLIDPSYIYDAMAGFGHFIVVVGREWSNNIS